MDPADQQRLDLIIKNLQQHAPDAFRQELATYSEELVEEMKANAPHDTGFMRDNVERTKLRGIQEGWEIKSNAGYSGYVEYGTRHKAARPWFFRAIDETQQWFYNNLIRRFDRIISRAK